MLEVRIGIAVDWPIDSVPLGRAAAMAPASTSSDEMVEFSIAGLVDWPMDSLPPPFQAWADAAAEPSEAIRARALRERIRV